MQCGYKLWQNWRRQLLGSTHKYVPDISQARTDDMKPQAKTYSTSELASIGGVHPNTVRQYEELEFITRANRKKNGYRVFTELQVCQVKLVRAAFSVELVQNNLRKEVLEIVKTAANCNFTLALELIEQRRQHLLHERAAAHRAIEIAKDYHRASQEEQEFQILLARTEAAQYVQTTIDSLRNWEMNGLLNVKRRSNGYRVYNGEDLKRLTLIRTLRMANYSLVSIKRLLDTLEADSTIDIHTVLNTPASDEDIVSVCDQLVLSLDKALLASKEMTALVKHMQNLDLC